MGKINPVLPAVGGDEDVWGDKANQAVSTVIGQGNDQEDRLVTLELDGSTAKIRIGAAEGNIQYLQTVVAGLTGTTTLVPVVALDEDGTPYVVAPSSTATDYFVTELGDRLILESGDGWLI